MKRRTLIALAPAVVMTACATPPAPPAPIHTSVTLLPDKATELAPGTTLRFERVADSRCPPDVRCVWAGELRYHFTLTSAAGSEAFSLTAQAPAAELSQGALRIALGPAAAPPKTAANAPATPHPVTLTIDRK
jgi:hypothetical protein